MNFEAFKFYRLLFIYPAVAKKTKLTKIYCLNLPACILFILGGLGLGPGAHRYFCHRSYKTNRGIKIFMIFCQQISGVVRFNNFFKNIKLQKNSKKFRNLCIPGSECTELIIKIPTPTKIQ